MKFKWWSKAPEYSVCKECGQHFTPVGMLASEERDFGDLCLEHRKPGLEKARRRSRVVGWATVNWERLEKQMDDEDKAVRDAYRANTRAQQEAMAAAQQNSCSPGNAMQGLMVNHYPQSNALQGLTRGNR